MKGWFRFWIILFIGLVACSAGFGDEPAANQTVNDMEVGNSAESENGVEAVTAVLPAVELENLGTAPEITNDVWINSETALTLEALRGKVVLVEFWTFGCINCQHVIPSLKEWYSKYKGDSFEILGIHYPEFRYEKEYQNVVEATQQLGIEYPVAIDNQGVTWRAYQQRYWPTLYLVDKWGNIRYKHIGEGAYDETEVAIQVLMAEVYP